MNFICIFNVYENSHLLGCVYKIDSIVYGSIIFVHIVCEMLLDFDIRKLLLVNLMIKYNKSRNSLDFINNLILNKQKY